MGSFLLILLLVTGGLQWCQGQENLIEMKKGYFTKIKNKDGTYQEVCKIKNKAGKEFILQKEQATYISLTEFCFMCSCQTAGYVCISVLRRIDYGLTKVPCQKGEEGRLM